MMYQKITKKKYAEFAPDMFSIHTFELTCKLKKKKFYAIKKKLFDLQESRGLNGMIYKDKQWMGSGERYLCFLLRENGLRISLEQDDVDRMNLYYIRIIVNPRTLIDPGSSYVGILPPERSSVDRVARAFSKVMAETDFPANINDYQLTRVDLCVNIRCDNKKIFRELVRVLRKLPAPPKYERKKFKHKDKKKANMYNKHYLCYACDTRELVIYDKTYQIVENGLMYDYEKLPNGVLRFEIQNNRAYIQKVEKKLGEMRPKKMLCYFIETSRKEIIRTFSRCFSDAVFMRPDEMELQIKAKHKGDKRKAMLALTGELQRVQSVERAVKRIEKQGYDGAWVLRQFEKQGISPIPLRKGFCAKVLPGPVELLKCIEDGSLQAEYEKVKYK